jgi:hypothetical protein
MKVPQIPQARQVPSTEEGAELLKFDYRFLVKFHVYTQQYTTGQIVPVERWVNAVSCKNAGTAILNFMGDPLQPGETKSIGGNAMEVWDEKHMDISFTNTGLQTQLAVITQKWYVGITKASLV